MIFFNTKSYAIPTVVSVFLHAVVLFFVIGGWQETQSRTPVPVPKYIPAKLIQLEKTAPKAQPKPQPKTIDRAAQQRDRERQRREEERRRQQEIVQKQKAEKENQDRERKEREQQAQAEKQRREQERQRLLEQELSQTLAEEEALIQSEEDEELANSYSDVIYSKVYQNWSYPPSTRKGMRCEIRVTIVPTGRVINVTLKESSGNAAFDRSAEQAVWKAEQFPELKEVPSAVFEQYFRNIVLIFEPQDTRL